MTDHTELLREALKLFPDISQLLDGWHHDGNWTEWDQSVRQRVSELHKRVNAALAESAPAKESAAPQTSTAVGAALKMSDENIRKIFEAWATDMNLNIHQENGRYRSSYTDWCWHAFFYAMNHYAAELDHLRLAGEPAFVCIRRSFLAWLLGEDPHPDTEEWFERPDGGGAYWWRSALRKEMFTTGAVE